MCVLGDLQEGALDWEENPCEPHPSGFHLFPGCRILSSTRADMANRVGAGWSVGVGMCGGHKGRGVLGRSRPHLLSLCLQSVGSVMCGLNGTYPA